MWSVFGYIATPEEVHPYITETWDAVQSGLFKIRIQELYPFTADGLRDAQKDLTTPGGKVAGKLLVNISEEP